MPDYFFTEVLYSRNVHTFFSYFSLFLTLGMSEKITGLMQESDNKATLEFLTKGYGFSKLLFISEMIVPTRNKSFTTSVHVFYCRCMHLQL